LQGTIAIDTVPVIDARIAAGTTGRFGHPKGLFYLAFTEAWERFSFYGMSALLVLYMVDQLLLPGHAEHVGGLAALRAQLEAVLGPLSSQAFASQIFGLYSGLVYFTPLLGGAIADRWIGQRNAVVLGALLMAGGHIAMAFDGSFLAALALLIGGSGFLKGNIAAQVGALYAHDDEARRARGYMIFSTGINIGGSLGSLLCGLLAQLYGWHFGFGVAAVFMLLGVATYLSGYRYLPARVERVRGAATQQRLTAAEWRIVLTLIVIMAITVFQSAATYQLFNVLPVWAQGHVDRGIAGFQIPVPWFLSINSVASIVGVPLLFWWWRRRRREPDDLQKIGIGAWLAALSNLVLVGAIYAAGDAPVNAFWPILYSVGLGIAFLYYWPTLLALVSRAAPPRVNATLMGLAYMGLFASNVAIGWLGGFYERLGPAAFWAMHAAIAAAGGVLILLFGRRITRVLQTA
jgi:POT family proton-dependent oligopeptide transporter